MGIRDDVLPNPAILLRPLSDREAIGSSALEGTYATPKELLLFELEPENATSAHDKRNVSAGLIAARLSSSRSGRCAFRFDGARHGASIALGFDRECTGVRLLSGVHGGASSPKAEEREARAHELKALWEVLTTSQDQGRGEKAKALRRAYIISRYCLGSVLTERPMGKQGE